MGLGPGSPPLVWLLGFGYESIPYLILSHEMGVWYLRALQPWMDVLAGTSIGFAVRCEYPVQYREA